MSTQTAPAWLETTPFLDHDHPAVRDFAQDTAGSIGDAVERAVALFYGTDRGTAKTV